MASTLFAVWARWMIVGYGEAVLALLLAGVLVVRIAGGVFLVRIAGEEQLMLRTFGEQYARYQRRVPRLERCVHV